MSPQHETVLVGRTQTDGPTEYFVKVLRVRGIEVFAILVQRVDRLGGIILDTGNEWHLLSADAVDKHHEAVVVRQLVASSVDQFLKVAVGKRRQRVVGRHINDDRATAFRELRVLFFILMAGGKEQQQGYGNQKMLHSCDILRQSYGFFCNY